ncbi:MAG: hypothetical protein IJO70_00840 [Lachnospiraceae bacterium]|nr:hypothetical protein [Lachnospiraceae bacterium]
MGKMEQKFKDHIEIGEMIEFVCYDETGIDRDKFLNMSNRINCHIYKCDVCKKKYYSILEFYDICQDNEMDFPAIKKELKCKFERKL